MKKINFYRSERSSLPLLLCIILFATMCYADHNNTTSQHNEDPLYGNGNYALSSSTHKSLLIAAGCFWCAEQAFEQYAPGVIEVISGYAGSTGVDFPTYKNHPGHREVILIEYDPKLTSYELLLQYAWRNLDPFDSYGQFCDKGFSYQSAIFYANEEELMIAERVRDDILDLYPEWTNSSVVVPLLERPYFWMAEDYHQNYYIKNPRNYGYYKERCGRTKRLKEVWGNEQYYCYHDLDLSCFNDTVVNEDGVDVVAVVNAKNVEESGNARMMAVWQIVVVSVAAAVLGILIIGFAAPCKKKKTNIMEQEVNDEMNVTEEEEQAAEPKNLS
jgi:peptide-methionine (S)-S-oxide reductase